MGCRKSGIAERSSLQSLGVKRNLLIAARVNSAATLNSFTSMAVPYSDCHSAAVVPSNCQSNDTPDNNQHENYRDDDFPEALYRLRDFGGIANISQSYFLNTVNTSKWTAI
jgi:hypothetical protein